MKTRKSAAIRQFNREGGTIMRVFDIASDIESQIAKFEQAMAVMGEAEQYFETNERIKYLPVYGERVLRLLYAANDLFLGALSALRTTVERLYDYAKEDAKIHHGNVCEL